VKNIVITGATGYLGSNLVKFLHENKQYNIFGTARRTSDITKIKDYCNIVYTDELDECFKNNKIDIIIHLTTNYNRDNILLLEEILMDNVIFPLQIIQIMKKYNVKEFINIDTCLKSNVSQYAFSKKQFRDCLIFLNIPTKNLILQHFYGPNNTNKDFISSIIKRMKNNQIIDLTIGVKKRDFIYIDDVVKAIGLCIDYQAPTKFYNIEIGSGELISIHDLVVLMKEISDSKSILNFGVVPLKEWDKYSYIANIEFLKTLGWKCNVNIKDGLIKVIKGI